MIPVYEELAQRDSKLFRIQIYSSLLKSIEAGKLARMEYPASDDAILPSSDM